MKILTLVATALLIIAPVGGKTETISSTSGPLKNGLLELYTSEGCSSCPPAEAWLSIVGHSELYESSNLIPMAFHVDYWDYLGWKDRFADPAYSVRQKRHQISGGIRSLYTPQLVFNANELRPTSRLPGMFEQARQSQAVVELGIALERNNPEDNSWSVEVTSTPIQGVLADQQSLYIAVTENNLSTSVTRGENHGRFLSHDYVVRKLIGPIDISLASEQSISKDITLAKDWQPGNLNLVAFVQSNTGEILQAVTLNDEDINAKYKASAQ